MSRPKKSNSEKQEAAIKKARVDIQKSIDLLRVSVNLEYTDYVPILGMMLEQLSKAIEATDIMDIIKQKKEGEKSGKS